MSTDNQKLIQLAKAMLALSSQEQAIAFLQDLCTPQELEDLCVRWRVVDELNQGLTYREIHTRTGASLTTIGRVANALKYGSGGYQKIFDAIKQHQHTHDKEHL